MEWLIVLAIVCLAFAFKIVMDHLRNKKVIAPRIERLEEAREVLQSRLVAAKGELEAKREQLGPLMAEIQKMEEEYQELERQLQEERSQKRGGSDESLERKKRS